MGARVVALAVRAERLAFSTLFGAVSLMNTGTGDPVEAMKAFIAHPRRPQGRGRLRSTRKTIDSSARHTALGRRLSGRRRRRRDYDVSPDMLRKQLTVIGSSTLSDAVQAECARFVADRSLRSITCSRTAGSSRRRMRAYRIFQQADGVAKGCFQMP